MGAMGGAQVGAHPGALLGTVMQQAHTSLEGTEFCGLRTKEGAGGQPRGFLPFLQEMLQPPGLVEAVNQQNKHSKCCFKLDRKRPE